MADGHMEYLLPVLFHGVLFHFDNFALLILCQEVQIEG